MAMSNNQMVILVCDANYGRLSITSPPGCSSLIRRWHQWPPSKKTWLRPVDASINPKYSIKYQSTSWFFGYWYFEKPKMFFSETCLATSLAWSREKHPVLKTQGSTGSTLPAAHLPWLHHTRCWRRKMALRSEKVLSQLINPNTLW